MDIHILSMLFNLRSLTYLPLDSNWSNGENGAGTSGVQVVSYYGLSPGHPMQYGHGIPNTTTVAYT